MNKRDRIKCWKRVAKEEARIAEARSRTTNATAQAILAALTFGQNLQEPFLEKRRCELHYMRLLKKIRKKILGE